MHISFGFLTFLESHLQMRCKDRTLNDIGSSIGRVDKDLSCMTGDKDEVKSMTERIMKFEMTIVIVACTCFLLISIYDFIVFQW